MGLFDRAVASSFDRMPRRIVRRVAGRYIAGEELEDALAVTRELNEDGCRVTLDLLGEDIREFSEAEAAAAVYGRILDAVAEQGLDANVSIKPTQFGLALHEERFRSLILAIIEHARERDNFVRIDMEDSPTTDATLAAFRAFREAGHHNVGIVLQAMLRRTKDDARALAPLQPDIRICKGVYVEPPEVAYQGYDEVNRAFLRFLEAYLPDPDFHLRIATHDDPVIEGAERLLAEHGLGPDRYEFQMLLGVRPEVRERLVAAGHPLRVYVPFGKAWYAYCERRLKENPKFAGYIARDVLGDPRMLLKRSRGGKGGL